MKTIVSLKSASSKPSSFASRRGFNGINRDPYYKTKISEFGASDRTRSIHSRKQNEFRVTNTKPSSTRTILCTNTFNFIQTRGLMQSFRNSMLRKKTVERHIGHHHTHDYDQGLNQNSEERKKEAVLASRITVIGLATNLIMAAGKTWAGMAGGSVALISDAAHSFSDIISDVVTLVAVKVARRPTDKRHPYGWGKWESVGALCVGCLLVATGIEIGHHSIEHLFDSHPPEMFALWVAAVSVLVKEALYQITARIGKKQGSQVLIANAWHHRSDAISSIVALIGVAGAELGLSVLDPIAVLILTEILSLLMDWQGLAVAVLIAKSGFDSVWSSAKELTDTVTDEEISSALEEISKKVPGVIHAYNARTRLMGTAILSDIHIDLDPNTSVSAASEVAAKVRNEILQKYPRMREVQVTVNPASSHQMAQSVQHSHEHSHEHSHDHEHEHSHEHEHKH